MDKKNLMIEIGYKIRKIREALKLKNSELAENIGHHKSSFCRYEQGKTPVRLITLYKLGEKYNISLDWLIRDKGPMYYKEKEIEAKDINGPEEEIVLTNVSPPQPTLDSLPGDIRELLDHMEKIPLLRHEVLAFFLKFKDKNKEMVANAFAHRQERPEENNE